MLRIAGRTFFNVVDFATVSSSSTNNENRIWWTSNVEDKFDSFNDSTPGAGRCFAASADGKALATASDQNSFCVWSGVPYQVAHVFHGHERVVSALTFSHDGRHIASGSWDRRALVWSLEDQSLLLTLQGTRATYWRSIFHPTEPRIFTAGADRHIRVWDMATGLETATLTGHKATDRSSLLRY